MKIEVGQYVRTKKGSIAKVLGVDVFEEGKGMDISNLEAVYFDNIVNDIDKDIYCGCFNEVFKECKTSFNIIDLIEVGDIITYKYCAFERIYTCELDNLELFELTKRFIEEKSIEIKSIVTKEQFKEVEYRIGE